MESISFPWSNINHHHQQEPQEHIIHGSENIFLNPITASTGGQINSYRQSTPAELDTNWYQSLAVNELHDHEDDNISVIFSDHSNSYTKRVKNLTGVSSNDSVTKETDDGNASQCSSKRRRSDPIRSASSTINFRQPADSDETESDVIAQMKEMMYTAAAFRPVSFAYDDVKKPKRRNVRISSDPQTVAARRRRERVSERIRVLQKLVPGGDKMDTASMLDEAANYLKFLRSQVKALEQFGMNVDHVSFGATTNAYGTSQNAQNASDGVTLGLPFPMQGHFLLHHQ